MKKVFAFSILGLLSLLFFGFQSNSTLVEAPQKNVKWYTWDEAIKAMEQEKKKIFVDVYTDWCGWCKRMDAQTFEDPKIAALLNEHFYPVKLDAEQKEEIIFQGHTFNYVESGRRGVHTLAYSLLDGKMSYPTVVFLDEELKRILIAPGFQDVAGFSVILRYAYENAYKTTTWGDYIK